ncbi:MAG: DUF4398 domain-containing protein [Deltaproteobacteria bacterium]|nr:DUF4398 domain-containing protein [Deltaproteobacteria bacterium]
MKKSTFFRPLATALAAVGVCMAAGCSTTDTVSSRFPQLEANITAAKSSGAETYAPEALKSAVSRLEAAKSAVAANDMVSANKLVDEAMADADYARVKAPTEQAKQEALQLKEDIQTLRDDIKRISSAQ